MLKLIPTKSSSTSHSPVSYCKILNFSCILICWFWSVEISLHFNVAFSQGLLCKEKFQMIFAMWAELCITVCTNGQFSTFDFSGQFEFLREFKFAILCNSQNSRKLDTREKLVFYSMTTWSRCQHNTGFEKSSTVLVAVVNVTERQWWLPAGAELSND